MAKLDEEWIISPKPNPSDPSRKCKAEEKIPTTLGLDNMRDSFILIAAGKTPVPYSSSFRYSTHFRLFGG
jgi:hypothetical protein